MNLTYIRIFSIVSILALGACTSDSDDDLTNLVGSWELTSAIVIGNNCGGAAPLTQFVPSETSCQSIAGLGEICLASCWVFKENNLLSLEVYRVFVEDNNRRELVGADSVEYIIEEGGRMSLCELDGSGCETIEYNLNNNELRLKFFDDCEFDAGFTRKN